jgi:hypothetical protein
MYQGHSLWLSFACGAEDSTGNRIDQVRFQKFLSILAVLASSGKHQPGKAGAILALGLISLPDHPGGRGQRFPAAMISALTERTILLDRHMTELASRLTGSAIEHTL